MFEHLLFFNSLAQLRNFFGINDKIIKFSTFNRKRGKEGEGRRSNCLSRVRSGDWHRVIKREVVFGRGAY